MSRWRVLEQFARHRYGILFCALLATIAVGPVLEAMTFGDTTMETLLSVTLLAAVAPMVVARRRRAILLFVIAALLLRMLASHLDSAAMWVAGALVWGGVAVVAAFGAVRFALSTVRVDAEHLFAALSAYLLIGVCWSVIYVAVVRFDPGAMMFVGAPLTRALGMGDALYFSFVTLATLGYGDFTPASPVMRGLSVFEAIIGQLYLAILVARLVSLRASGSPSA